MVVLVRCTLFGKYWWDGGTPCKYLGAIGKKNPAMLPDIFSNCSSLKNGNKEIQDS